MKFDPNNIDNSKSGGFEPFPPGLYDFEVDSAEETVSKAGNPMIKAKINIYNEAGQKRVIFDYLLSNQVWKLKAFAEAIGMHEEFASGEMDVFTIEGRSGKAKVAIDRQEGYEPRNKILAYLATKGEAREIVNAVRPPKALKADLDDEIPF